MSEINNNKILNSLSKAGENISLLGKNTFILLGLCSLAFSVIAFNTKSDNSYNIENEYVFDKNYDLVLQYLSTEKTNKYFSIQNNEERISGNILFEQYVSPTERKRLYFVEDVENNGEQKRYVVFQKEELKKDLSVKTERLFFLRLSDTNTNQISLTSDETEKFGLLLSQSAKLSQSEFTKIMGAIFNKKYVYIESRLRMNDVDKVNFEEYIAKSLAKMEFNTEIINGSKTITKNHEDGLKEYRHTKITQLSELVDFFWEYAKKSSNLNNRIAEFETKLHKPASTSTTQYIK